jgi:hypothetical protein
MSMSRDEALAAARKRLRGFGSAPDPRRHARSIYAELAQFESWRPGDRRKIAAFGAWLLDRPPISEIKPRCEQLILTLG